MTTTRKPDHGIDTSTAGCLKRLLRYPEFYFRTNSDQSDEFNVILTERDNLSLESERFNGIAIYSQYREQLIFVTSNDVRQLRETAFNFVNGMWIRKDNVLGGSDPGRVYLKLFDETFSIGVLKCKCKGGDSILVKCTTCHIENNQSNADINEDIILKIIHANSTSEAS